MARQAQHCEVTVTAPPFPCGRRSRIVCALVRPCGGQDARHDHCDSMGMLLRRLGDILISHPASADLRARCSGIGSMPRSPGVINGRAALRACLWIAY
jgi:hypothetical protein